MFLELGRKRARATPNKRMQSDQSARYARIWPLMRGVRRYERSSLIK